MRKICICAEIDEATYSILKEVAEAMYPELGSVERLAKEMLEKRLRHEAQNYLALLRTVRKIVSEVIGEKR